MDWSTLASTQLPSVTAGDGSLDALFLRDGQPSCGYARGIESLEERVDHSVNEIIEKVRAQAFDHIQSRHTKRYEQLADNAYESFMNERKTHLQQKSNVNSTSQNDMFVHPSITNNNNHHQDSLLLAQDYLAIVKHHAVQKVNNATTTNANAHTEELIEAFVRPTLTASSSSSPFTEAWKLVKNQQQFQTSSSLTSSICGTLSYLSDRFRDRFTRPGVASLLESVQMYQQDTLQLSSLGVWPSLYFLLQCGDVVGAAHIACPDPTVHHILQELASQVQQQQGATSIWEWCCSGSDTTRLRACLSPYQQTLLPQAAFVQQAQPPNVYQIGVYNLLTFEQPPISSEHTEGFKTFEDYIYASLWDVLCCSSDMQHALGILAKELCALGPERVSMATTGPWGYALALMAVQHHGDALRWIQQQHQDDSFFFQAVHIALVLLAAPPPELGTTVQHPLQDVGVTLLRDYAHRLRNMDDAAAYLMHIPNESKACREIGQLLLVQEGSVNQLAAAVGELDPQGQRSGGTLSTVLSPAMITKVLNFSAAMIVSERPKSTDRKILLRTCYEYAGRFADVLKLMNQCIAIHGNDDDALDREFWLEELSVFLTRYQLTSTQSSSHVMKVLRDQHKETLVEASVVLMKLNAFFRAHHAHSPNAQILLQELHSDLLPTNVDKVQACVEKYKAYDETVQEAYPNLLLAAMSYAQQQQEQSLAYVSMAQEIGAPPAVRLELQKRCTMMG